MQLKPSILSALVMAFAGVGDAFLYTALPVNAKLMNVPLMWVGLLLSINRFVRLLANHMFAYLFNHYGFKMITTIAAVFAVLTTFSYGVAGGLLLWIAARVIWGFSFAALRISSICYSLQNKAQGFSLGLSKAVQELGPVIALLIGPVLLQWTGPAITFSLFALMSVMAVIISFYLPELKHVPENLRMKLNPVPSSFNLLTFLSAFIVQGILVVVVSRLLLTEVISLAELTVLAGFYLAYRRICLIIISPLGGLLSDKLGMRNVYLLSLLLTIAGLVLISFGLPKAGIITVFTFNSITLILSPGHAVRGEANQLSAIAVNSTWGDLGAASGTLAGGVLLTTEHPANIFFLATFTLVVACALYISTNFQTIKLIWK